MLKQKCFLSFPIKALQSTPSAVRETRSNQGDRRNSPRDQNYFEVASYFLCTNLAQGTSLNEGQF